MIKAEKRNPNIKARKFRNMGRATGVINRKNGENTCISLKISDLDKFLAKYGDYSNIDIDLEGERINTSIIELQRDTLIHNAININLREI